MPIEVLVSVWSPAPWEVFSLLPDAVPSAESPDVCEPLLLTHRQAVLGVLTDSGFGLRWLDSGACATEPFAIMPVLPGGPAGATPLRPAHP